MVEFIELSKATKKHFMAVRHLEFHIKLHSWCMFTQLFSGKTKHWSYFISSRNEDNVKNFKKSTSQYFYVLFGTQETFAGV